MKPLDLHIEGMTCAACSGRIEKVLNRLPGVHAEVSLLEHRARVTGTDADTAIAAIRRAGYQAWPVDPRATSARHSATDQRNSTNRSAEKVRLVIAIVCLIAMSAEMVAMLAGQHAIVPATLQWLLATVMQTVVAWPLYLAAWRVIRAGSASMETLVSIGTLAAYAWSCATLWAWVAQPMASKAHELPALYFETSVVVLAMVTIGRAIEQRARQHALDALSELIALDSSGVQAWNDATDQWQNTPPDRIAVGQRIRIGPNTAISLDCVVGEGQTEVDESAMTGESQPVVKSPGEPLYAGCINLTGTVTATVSAGFEHSRRAQMGNRILAALGSRAPIAALADRIAAVFVPTVLVIAALTFLGGWWFAQSLQTGLIHAVAVLVVACPCALGLATPAAIAAGLARSAQHGWFFRSADALQRAADISHVVLDKTGTLTTGRPVIVATSSSDAWPAWLAAAAGAERGVEHPLAGALLSYAAGRPMPQAISVEVHPGHGISASLHINDAQTPSTLRVGRPEWINGAPDSVKDLHPQASAVDVAIDGHWCGRLWMADAPRSDAAAAIAALHHHGIQTEILSGDRIAAVKAIADLLGVAAYQAGQTPEAKSAHLDANRRLGKKTAMVGDGINDASAMAHAHLGIAMASGARMALETADVTISSKQPLAGAANSLALARTVMRRVRENLFFAFAFNTLAIPLAIFGKLSPALAGAAMAASSSLVMLNAARLLRWSPPQQTAQHHYVRSDHETH